MCVHNYIFKLGYTDIYIYTFSFIINYVLKFFIIKHRSHAIFEDYYGSPYKCIMIYLANLLFLDI